MTRPNNPETFWGLVQGDQSVCWPWPKSRNPKGYGTAYYQGVKWQAHRLAWYLAYGPIPKDLLVCHECDNPPCVNPAHLFLGTNSLNILDAAAKGRLPRKGERNGRAVVTADDVAHIRELYREGGVSQRRLGEQFGLSDRQISNIVRGAAWAS